jgi:hypothetical protein
MGADVGAGGIATGCAVVGAGAGPHALSNNAKIKKNTFQFIFNFNLSLKVKNYRCLIHYENSHIYVM